MRQYDWMVFDKDGVHYEKCHAHAIDHTRGIRPFARVKAWCAPNEDQAEPAIRGERAVRLDHRMMLMADLTNKDHFHVRIAPGEWLVGALHWPNLKADKQAFHDHR